MKTCLIIFLFITAILFIVDLYNFNKLYKDFTCSSNISFKDTVLMKFKEWKKIYNLNKERFTIYKNNIYYGYYDEPRGWESYRNAQYLIIFNKIDYLKFLIYYMLEGLKEKSKVEKENNFKNNKAMIEIIENVQKDINKLKQQSENELNFVSALNNTIKEESIYTKDGYFKDF